MVRLTDRPDMTSAVYHGRKTTTHLNSYVYTNAFGWPLAMFEMFIFSDTGVFIINFSGGVIPVYQS